jgi:hypothetical protein
MLIKLINDLESALSTAGSISTGFINDVNSFPSIAILRPSITRQHIGDSARYDSYRFIIRGYVQTDENAISEADELARTIESIIQSMQYDIRVLSLETDEGLLEPYGMCDIECIARILHE